MSNTDVKGAFVAGKTRIKYGGAYTDSKDFAAIKKVLDRNWWTIDEEGKLLEKELARFAKVKYCTLTNSGSSALLVAFAALKLPEGSEVITGAVQFPTAISALYYNRLTPVYIDVTSSNLSLDPNLIEQAITKKTKAILVVAVAGNIPHIDSLVFIAKKHKLKLILDNCDGFGGTWNKKPIETYFDIAATSFHAAHILCMGEGGAIFTNNKQYGQTAASLREWGRLGGYDGIDDLEMLEGIPDDYPARYLFNHIGFNVKPLELQCAMGRTQLRKLKKIKKRRARNFAYLFDNLQENLFVLPLPFVYTQASPSWFGFPMFASDRAGLREFLESRNIETRTIFGGNITRQPAFRNFGRIASYLGNADWVMEEGMFISVHPSLTKQKLKYIVSSIKKYYA